MGRVHETFHYRMCKFKGGNLDTNAVSALQLEKTQNKLLKLSVLVGLQKLT